MVGQPKVLTIYFALAIFKCDHAAKLNGCPEPFKKALKSLLETDIKFGEDNSKSYIANALDIDASNRYFQCVLKKPTGIPHGRINYHLRFLESVMHFFMVKSATFLYQDKGTGYSKLIWQNVNITSF